MIKPPLARLRILFVVREPWPTFRADIRVLFGRYLPRMGLLSDLVTERVSGVAPSEAAWPGGQAFLWTGARSRALYHLGKLLHTARALIATRGEDYGAIQVRDMPVHALLALLVAKARGLAFFYWMSFPMPESHVLRAKARGWTAGPKYWFPLVQGLVGTWLLYRIVLPTATHVFVQSRQMKEDVVRHGIDEQRITPVPMGVDLEELQLVTSPPIHDPRLAGRKVLVHLGTLARERKIERLFDALALVVRVEPSAMLLLVGDSDEQQHLQSLHRHAERCGVADNVLWTGWLPRDKAWKYVASADIGISPFPRGPLLDSASPTKAVEYMALGLPIVVNDNPDQETLVRESGAGYCVEYEPEAFSRAILDLLANPALRSRMSEKGRRYVREHRSYLRIAETLASTYRELLGCQQLKQDELR